MGGINSRAKGNQYEVKVMNELIELGFNCLTSRNESKRLDDAGVDLVTNFPFHLQLKRTEQLRDPEGVLDSMPRDKPRAILHKKNRKQEIIILEKNEFYLMVLELERLRNGK